MIAKFCEKMKALAPVVLELSLLAQKNIEKYEIQDGRRYHGNAYFNPSIKVGFRISDAYPTSISYFQVSKAIFTDDINTICKIHPKGVIPP